MRRGRGGLPSAPERSTQQQRSEVGGGQTGKRGKDKDMMTDVRLRLLEKTESAAVSARRGHRALRPAQTGSGRGLPGFSPWSLLVSMRGSL